MVLEEYRFPLFKQCQFYMASNILKRLRLGDETALPNSPIDESGAALTPVSGEERNGIPALCAALRAWGCETDGTLNSVGEVARDAALRVGYSGYVDMVKELEMRGANRWSAGGEILEAPKRGPMKLIMKLKRPGMMADPPPPVMQQKIVMKPAAPVRVTKTIYKEDPPSDEDIDDGAMDDQDDDFDEDDFANPDDDAEDEEIMEKVRKAAAHEMEEEDDWADDEPDEDVTVPSNLYRPRTKTEIGKDGLPIKKKMMLNLSLKKKQGVKIKGKAGYVLEEIPAGEALPPPAKLNLSQPAKKVEKKVHQVKTKRAMDGKAALLKKLGRF